MSSSTAGTSAMWVGIGLGVLITISVSYLAVWYYRRRSAVIAMQEYKEEATPERPNANATSSPKNNLPSRPRAFDAATASGVHHWHGTGTLDVATRYPSGGGGNDAVDSIPRSRSKRLSMQRHIRRATLEDGKQHVSKKAHLLASSGKFEAAIAECRAGLAAAKALVHSASPDERASLADLYLCQAYAHVQLGEFAAAVQLLDQPNMFNDASILEENVFSTPAIVDEIAVIHALVARFDSVRALVAAAQSNVTATTTVMRQLAAELPALEAALLASCTRAPLVYAACIGGALALRDGHKAVRLADELLAFEPHSEYARDAKRRGEQLIVADA